MRGALLLSLLLSASALKWSTIDAGTSGCHGSTYTPRASYGARATHWGNVGRGGWRGTVLGPNGDKIYGIPTNATTVLEIDPIKRTLLTFGVVGESERSERECAGSKHCGEDKWIGGVLAANGKIFGIPYAAESVLEIDPATRTASTFGVVSSSVKRKWVEGVLGANKKIYGIPYDADVVLEIDPDTHALFIFGSLGRFGDGCKWYGGVLAPNGNIYAIPYSAPYVLEINPDKRTAEPFAFTQTGWAKWSGGVLAGNGKIYGVPALSRGVLEIDIESRKTELYGMLPAGNNFDDKWNGAVLAPNGKIYGIPWRMDKVLEFDPDTKAISLVGSTMGSTNYTWHGGVLTKDGRIIAVPYNSAWILEIGESVCSSVSSLTMGEPTRTEQPSAALSMGSPESRMVQQDKNSLAPPPGIQALVPQPKGIGQTLAALRAKHPQTFVLALLGCPEAVKASEDACFHLSHRTWHSAMITLMKPDSMLVDIRDQVIQARLSHLPTNFCFLYNGHPLDPNVEGTMKAVDVAVSYQSQYIVLIDNVHCNIGPDPSSWLTAASSSKTKNSDIFFQTSMLAMVLSFVSAFVYAIYLCTRPKEQSLLSYESVPFNVDHSEKDSDHNSEPGHPPVKMVPCLHPVPCLLHPRLRGVLIGRSQNQSRGKLSIDPKDVDEDDKDVHA